MASRGILSHLQNVVPTCRAQGLEMAGLIEICEDYAIWILDIRPPVFASFRLFYLIIT